MSLPKMKMELAILSPHPPHSNVLCSLSSLPLIKLHRYNTIFPKRKKCKQIMDFILNIACRGRNWYISNCCRSQQRFSLLFYNSGEEKVRQQKRKYKVITTESDSRTEKKSISLKPKCFKRVFRGEKKIERYEEKPKEERERKLSLLPVAVD